MTLRPATVRLAAASLVLLLAAGSLHAGAADLTVARTAEGVAAPAPAPVDVAAARTLFAAYEAGDAAFDPAVADLYCDTALIVDKRTLANGEIREVATAASSYKALIRETMPLARERDDRNEYRDVVFVAVGAGVRISATRHSVHDDVDSPLQLTVGDCGGKPAIVEELSQSVE